jgi:hypothetical protein
LAPILTEPPKRLAVIQAGAPRLVGCVDAYHLFLGAACIGVGDAHQLSHSALCCAGVCGRWDAKSLVPAAGGLLEHDGQRLRGEFRQHHGEEGGPLGNGSAAAAPIVDLAWGDAGEPGERRLADVRTGEQNGEFCV